MAQGFPSKRKYWWDEARAAIDFTIQNLWRIDKIFILID